MPSTELKFTITNHELPENVQECFSRVTPREQTCRCSNAKYLNYLAVMSEYFAVFCSLCVSFQPDLKKSRFDSGGEWHRKRTANATVFCGIGGIATCFLFTLFLNMASEKHVLPNFGGLNLQWYVKILKRSSFFRERLSYFTMCWLFSFE